ncbi:TniQ family protein [Streptomyces silvensis]|uniref:HTH lysR-type domain-containing protein n=1 Tax=Streptomyces silvensis TaxID=1765722 RepID=A0A0W7WYX0_9ACTN|nr:TniQ family protein [Streptomyces silvensis]KUF15774.1 hypothetical protein AT728_13705 [Streptomyces silvensis]
MSRRTLPIRLAPLPGEALDSWFEATAHRLHTPLTHLLPQLGLSPRRSRSNRTADIPTDWTVLLRPAEAHAVAAATGTAPDQLTAMTLEQYNHRAVEIDTATRQVMRQVLWGRARGSRFCPDCLRDNGGRWPLPWRLGWTFACTTHQRLLADLCPHCGHIPRQSSHPLHVIPQQGLCAAPLAANGRRSTRARCHTALTAAESRHLGPDHPALLAQLALDEIIASDTIGSGIYTGRPQPVRTVLADMHSVAVRALNAPSLSNLVGFVPADLLDAYEGVRALKPGQSSIANPPKRLGFMTPPSAITTAVSLTAAVRVLATNDVQDAAETLRQFLPNARKFHGQLSPTSIDRWGHACSPVIKAVRLAAVGPLLRPTDQLRYRVASPFPGQHTSPDRVAERHRFVPTMFWPTWSLLLQPGTGLLPRVMRPALSAALLFVGSRLEYASATRLLAGRERSNTRHIIQQMFSDPQWRTIATALVRLADHLDTHPVPIDYQRRRKLDYTDLLPKEVWDTISRNTGILPGRLVRSKLARAFLFERLSGMPTDRAPSRFRINTAPERSLLAGFIADLTPDLATELETVAQDFLRAHGIAEPTTWQPPKILLTGLPLPGTDPDVVEVNRLHELVRRPDACIGRVAQALGTTIETVRYVLSEQPAPPPPKTLAQARATGDMRRWARTVLPKEEFARLYHDQQLSLRKIADQHGIGLKVITALGREYGILTRQSGGPIPTPIDREWLYDQYVVQQRTLGQIAADLDMSDTNLLRRAHQLGIPMRPGGGPSHADALSVRAQAKAAPPILGKVLTGTGAHERLRRFAAAADHRSMQAAARELGLASSTLVLQINRLERELGGLLFHRANRKRPMVLTPLGERLLEAIRRQQ